jgi:predicted PurR-regulated permease PerM
MYLKKKERKIMLNSKKIVALIVVLLLVVGIFTMQVKASDTIINFDELLNQTNSTNTLPTDEPANEVETNQQSTGSIVQPQTNKTTNTESGNNLPQTGVTEDITVMFFIVVCVVLAIYAYKKIRDYK